jgi:hypothetical protein
MKSSREIPITKHPAGNLASTPAFQRPLWKLKLGASLDIGAWRWVLLPALGFILLHSSFCLRANAPSFAARGGQPRPA